MTYFNRFFLFIIILVFSAPAIKAHVKLDVMLDGQTFLKGQLVILAWIEEVPHTTYNWDLLSSIDDGVTWDTIQADIPVEDRSYMWYVPDVQTDLARIKVVQDNEDQDYTVTSNAFTIGITTSTNELNEEALRVIPAFNPFPNPFQNRLHLGFTLSKTALVSLHIYNDNGQLIIDFPSERLLPDEYDYKWQTDDWPQGSYSVKLQADDVIIVRSLMLIRP